VLLLLLAPAAANDDDEQLLDLFKAAVRNREKLGRWTRGHGVCRFPGAACARGGRTLVSLSLAGVPLDVDFRDVASTLLRLGGVEVVSLRDANVSGSLADDSAAAGGWKCGQKLAELDLSGNSALRGSVADARALAGACSGLRELNLSGNALVGGKGDGGGRDMFTTLDVLDLSYNKITGDGELAGWGVSAGLTSPGMPSPGHSQSRHSPTAPEWSHLICPGMKSPARCCQGSCPVAVHLFRSTSPATI
jgi:protein brassinosteroid insensitive 1